MRQLREELVELLLALVEFTTTCIIDTKQGHDAVDDEQSVLIADEEFGDFVEKLHLMLGVDSAGIGDVILCYRLSVGMLSRIREEYIPVSGSTPKRSAI